MASRRLHLIALVPAAALVLGGCGGDADGGTSGAAVSIVASTNVYGDIAEQVAGDLANVTSIVTSASQDPHEYEASAQDRLALDDADVVIENGGGYDPFVDTLLEGSSSDPVVLNAVDISGLASGEDHADEEGHDGHDHVAGFNEHVWYDFHAVEKVAEKLSQELGELDPDNATTYAANYQAFAGTLEELEAQADALHAQNEGRHAMITEPVPLYLLAEVGLENLTPEEFSESVEEGADVPPRVLQDTLDLFTDEDIAVLAYNEQAADATTEEVKAAAQEAGVPVVDFTETLPDGTTYLEWQQDNLDHLAEVLGG